jgi:hypothetical protein
MYSELVESFSRYAKLITSQSGARNPARDDLAAEVVERLQQLNYIIHQLDEIDSQFGKMVTIEVINERGEKEHYNAAHERDQHLQFVMRLLTESFYYFSFRARQILRNKVHAFPGLGSFEAVGVRDVRNHLIEHPEGELSRVFNRTFMWSPDTGMHLKPSRHEWENSSFVDVGIKANAKEFAERLSAALDRATHGLASASLLAAKDSVEHATQPPPQLSPLQGEGAIHTAAKGP